MQQTSTDRNGFEIPATGLTAQQEQAASLFLSGMTVQEVADQLGVHRTTLWHWRKLETFQAYLNTLKSSFKEQAVEGLLSMNEEALITVRRVMKEGNDAAALKAATFVLSAIREHTVGETDARKLIRRQQADAFLDVLTTFDSASDSAYVARCRELGLKP